MKFTILKSRWHIYVSIFAIGLFIAFVFSNKISAPTNTNSFPANIEFDHYHAIEKHNNHYYAIREFNKNSDDYHRELWRYDQNFSQGEKIYTGLSIDFRIDPFENYAALNLNLNDLQIIDLQTKQIIFKYESDLQMNLEDWTHDGQLFWFHQRVFDPGLDRLSSLDISNWQIADYDLTSLKISEEFDFNPNNAVIVYSDYPATFDFINSLQVMNEKPQINLYLYDLDKRNIKLLTSQRTGRLFPKWIDNSTIEYTQYPALTKEMSHVLEELKTKKTYSEYDEARMAEVFDKWQDSRTRKKIIIGE